MKVVHVMIAAFYKEGYGYQENILPAKHRQLGCDVTIVTYDRYHVYGELTSDKKGLKTYINDNDVKVVVLPSNFSILRHLPIFIFRTSIHKTRLLYETLIEEDPDIIFVHGIQSADHEIIVIYKRKHPNVKVYCDNHADFYNTPIATIKKKLQTSLIGKRYVRNLTNVCERVWGVTPWRIDYLREVYGITGPKVGLLVMGGDEKKIDWENRLIIRKQFRSNHNIPQEAFVVVTGGKIDKAKNIHLLIEAIKNISHPMLYLVVFGNYTDDLNNYANVTDPHIINLGWMASDAVYDIFLASDFGAFPGTHSVLWEQACASGLPCLFKDWNGGFNHIDLGGNCILLGNITSETLTETIKEVMNDKVLFSHMRKITNEKCRIKFSYLEIAKEAIGII